MLKIHTVNPIATERMLKHPNYNITQWLDGHSIEYEHTEKNPDWVIVHVLYPKYLLENTNMITELSDKIKFRLRNGKAGLLFWYPYETENYLYVNIESQITGMQETSNQHCLIKVLVTGNLNHSSIVTDVHKDWASIHRRFMQLMSSTSSTDLVLLNAKFPKDSVYLNLVKSQMPKQLWQEVENISLRQLIKVKKFHEWVRNETAVDPIISKILHGKLVESSDIIMIPLMFFDWQLNTHLKQVEETNQIIQEAWYKWDKTKSFMCLNGKDKYNRRLMLRAIRKRKLEQHGDISYVCYNGIDSSLDINVADTVNVPLQNLFKRVHDLGVQPGFLDRVISDFISQINEKLKDNIPIILDQQPHQVRRNDRYMNPELYNNCWINVVTEAFSRVEEDCFITEKTFKPMLQLQPFLIQGNRYTLKKLKEFGYKTFPTLFNELYDELPTIEERTEAIADELSRWVTRSFESKQEIIKSVWKDLLHNQNHVTNLKHQDLETLFTIQDEN